MRRQAGSRVMGCEGTPGFNGLSSRIDDRNFGDSKGAGGSERRLGQQLSDVHTRKVLEQGWDGGLLALAEASTWQAGKQKQALVEQPCIRCKQTAADKRRRQTDEAGKQTKEGRWTPTKRLTRANHGADVHARIDGCQHLQGQRSGEAQASILQPIA